VSKSERNRAEEVRSFVDLCERAGFRLEAFQKRIAAAFFADRREFLGCSRGATGNRGWSPRWRCITC
jgi:hypothetical protein